MDRRRLPGALTENSARKAALDVCRLPHHVSAGDTQFPQPGAQAIFREAGDPSGLSVPNVARVGRILRALDAATRPEQLNLPGFYWHALQGEARWTIRVTGNWRITFAWDGADAVAVDLEDYH